MFGGTKFYDVSCELYPFVEKLNFPLKCKLPATITKKLKCSNIPSTIGMIKNLLS